jgi:hypothetical protein
MRRAACCFRFSAFQLFCFFYPPKVFYVSVSTLRQKRASLLAQSHPCPLCFQILYVCRSMFRALFIGFGLVASARAASPWSPASSESAANLLAKMELSDKLALLYGYGGGYVGDVPAFSKFGLPPINLEDGPQGLCAALCSCHAVSVRRFLMLKEFVFCFRRRG